jgi:hypothetical protein
VGDQGGAERGEDDAGRAVVHALTEDPQAARARVVSDQLITVFPTFPHRSSTIGLIGTPRKCLNPLLLAALGAVIVLVLAGCGDDDEEGTSATATQTQTEKSPPPPPTVTETQPQQEETEPELEPTETVEPPPETSPEDAPGGAGDEEPARSLALFTGRGGKITPRVVRVPAFISIRVELRSADGREYAIRFKGETVRVSSALGSVSTTFDGLRPGASIVGTPAGGGAKVRIEATAEPGP